MTQWLKNNNNNNKKNPSANAGNVVLSLSRDHPLEKEMATQSNILAWEIPWTEEPSELQSIELKKISHDYSN